MKTLAVHLHLYYTEQLPNILKYLRNMEDVDYDLFVTMIEANKDIEEQIKAFNKETKIWVVENRGYDIGPFIDFLHKINLDDYKYILKLHTKGNTSFNHVKLNGKRLNNKLWGSVLLDSLLKDKNRVKDNLNLLDNKLNIGMLSSEYCVTSEKQTYQSLLPDINNVLIKCGFNSTDHFYFVAGAMFYVRTHLLKPLLKYNIQNFEFTDAKIKEGTLAHILERVFGALIFKQGQIVQGVKYENYFIKILFVAVKRFLFQKKQQPHKLTIKIFKIPVYSRKERL